MEQMTAVQFERYGAPEVLRIATVARPRPAPGDVLVKVEASAVNWHDAIVRSGTLKMMTGRKFPLGLGLDFAGTVVSCGSDANAEGVGPGVRVWGMVSPKAGHVTGSAAQYVVVPADRVGLMPASLSCVEAASLVTSGTDALWALRDMAKVRMGERVLVRGAAGSVGMIAVQVARALGAHVVTLSSERDLEFVSRLGANEALDYRAVHREELGLFDVVFDTAGTDLLTWRRSLRAGGRMITIDFGSMRGMASIAASIVFGRQRVRTFRGYPDRQLLDDLAEYVKSGAVWPIVGTVYPLERVADAHRALGAKGHQGKIMLTTT